MKGRIISCLAMPLAFDSSIFFSFLQQHFPGRNSYCVPQQSAWTSAEMAETLATEEQSL